MAPRASTSRAQRSPSTSSSTADDAPPRRRRDEEDAGPSRASNVDRDDREEAADLAAVDIPDPLRTCRHLFLQTLISRKTLSLDVAKRLYKQCARICRLDGAPPLETFIAQMEPGLALCGLDIKMTRDQESGLALYILVNTIQDEPAKLATEYKAEEIAFFKAIVEKIMLAPRRSYSISQTDAVRCAKPPLTKTVAIQLIKSLLAKGWLALHPSARLILSPRSLVELAPYLRETFAQDPDEEDEEGGDAEARGPRQRIVVDCNDCLALVTSGYACPNPRCGIRLHTFCAPRRLGHTGQCSDHLSGRPDPCTQLWPRDPRTREFRGAPIGVAALGEEGEEGPEEREEEDGHDDDDDDEQGESRSHGSGISPSVGPKWEMERKQKHSKRKEQAEGSRDLGPSREGRKKRHREGVGRGEQGQEDEADDASSDREEGGPSARNGKISRARSRTLQDHGTAGSLDNDDNGEEAVEEGNATSEAE